jgi:methylglyoxal reductase
VETDIQGDLPRRRLGVYGPAISVIGLGGWEAGGGRTWGSNRSDNEVIRAMRTGFELGINWIDTAEVYAQGRSEEIIGKALCGYDDVLVFTKVAPRPDGSGVRGTEIREAVYGSLRRLGREVIDVYQVHWRDPMITLGETWEAMSELVDRGLVRHIGLSNVNVEDVQRCEDIRHVDSLQPQGSLLYRDDLDRMLPVCRQFGIGTVCYGSLAFGLLGGGASAGDYTDWRSGTYNMDDFFVAENYARFFAPAALHLQRRRVDAVHSLAGSFGLTPAQLALAWVIAQPGLTGAIVGSRSLAHITENVRAGTVSLTATQLKQIAHAAALTASD